MATHKITANSSNQAFFFQPEKKPIIPTQNSKSQPQDNSFFYQRIGAIHMDDVDPKLWKTLTSDEREMLLAVGNYLVGDEINARKFPILYSDSPLGIFTSTWHTKLWILLF